MAAISWKTGQSGGWGTAADWTGNPARVPGSGDAVTIAAAGNYTITISSAEAANSLVLNAAGAELLDTASLTIGTSFTETAGFVVLEAGSITGGKMSIAAGASLASAGASSMSAALTSNGEIDVSSGTLILSQGGSIAGTLDGSGTLALSSGTFVAAGGATLLGTGYEQLTNSAVMTATVTSSGATSTVGQHRQFRHRRERDPRDRQGRHLPRRRHTYPGQQCGAGFYHRSRHAEHNACRQHLRRWHETWRPLR